MTAAVDQLVELWSHDLDDYPTAVACSQRGSFVAAATSSGAIDVLDAREGDILARLPGHRNGTLTLSWSADETLLVSGGQDGVARVWEVAPCRLIAECDAGAPWVEHVAFDPRSTAAASSPQLFATAAGRSVRLWTADGRLVRSYAAHPSTVSAIAWRANAQELVTAAYGALTIWSPARDRQLRRFRWKGSILSIACSRDGRYIATGDQDCTVHFWRLKTGEDLQMSGYPAKVLQLAWDPSSRYLATGGSDVVTIWDCKRSPEGTRPRSCEGHDNLITALAYQHRGDVLASGDAAGMMLIWAPPRSSSPIARQDAGSEVAFLAWDPSDKAIIAATTAGRLSAYATIA